MSKFNFFQDCNNIEDLKAEYKKLAMQFHPDRPTGNLEKMKLLNNEYEILFALLKNKHKKVNEDKTETTYTSTEGTSETARDFINVINELINCEGLIIEISGSWLWLSGETKKYKDIIKSLNFRWASKKLMWYLKPEDSLNKKHKPMSMEDIRKKYGSQKIETKKTFSLI